MATIRRLTDSCLIVESGDGTTLIDPGFHAFDSGAVDLNSIGDVQRVLITHEHGDHVKPEFVRWLVDRGDDVRVHSNQTVRDLLRGHDIEVDTSTPAGVTAEDVVHGMTPLGTAPPNRAFTIDGVLTHPGDSFEPTSTASVLALPLVVLWGSTTAAVEFAARVKPRQAVALHDWYLSSAGREWVRGMASTALASHGIELVPLDWGDSYSP